MVQFKNVSKTYVGGWSAIKDIDFVIEEGEFVFLIGPSGSGKTTLIKLLIRDERPSTWDPQVMKDIIAAGMDCARVNGAFADISELDKVKKLVKDVSNEVSLMVDVKGPEVRLNKFDAAKPIKAGDPIVIGNTDKDEMYPSNYSDLYKHLKPGQRIVMGDGDVEMKIVKIEGDQMHCEVVYGQLLKPGKAMNLPGADIVTEVLTEKDKTNLKHAIETGWDFVSASFIQNAKAAQYVQSFIKEHSADKNNPQMKLIAKIEDQDGVDNIDEILEYVDGVMVARGGLGVELGLEKVPHVQRLLIEKCNAVGKPVITATQMMESMIENPRPTRAEISDVATAVLLGTDSVMLSGESSAGKYPVETVKFLTSTSLIAEEKVMPKIIHTKAHSSTTADALTKAAAEMCIEMDKEIDAVIVISKTGTTPRLLTRHNITQPIYAFVSNDYYMRTLLLSKGIMKAITFEGIQHESADYNRDHAIKTIKEMAISEGIVKKGQKVLFIGKTPINETGYFPNLFEIVEI